VKQTGQNEDKRLTDYLLGNLPEAEEVRLEEEYLANPDTQSRLLMVEDELVDAYVQGGLSAQERKQLEARFLASPRGRRKLELAKSLMTIASSQKPSPKPKPSPIFSIRWVFAAAAMILVLLVTWTIRQKVLQHPGPERAGSQQQQNGATGPSPSGTVAQGSKTSTPVESPQPSIPVMASIVLRPAARNVEQSPRVKIPRGALQLKVQLDLEADNHKSYKATLLGAGDDVKWSGRGLKTQPTASGRAVVLKLPATLFENAEYSLLLAPDEDAARPIAEYTFVVQKN
jgi:hypothetical protein